jgi:hypothetical protein
VSRALTRLTGRQSGSTPPTALRRGTRILAG